MIGLRNEAGEYLYVPKDIFDMFVASNPKVIEQMASNIENGRSLVIGTVKEGVTDEVVISAKEKLIFCDEKSDETEDVLFPELVHGEHVVLEGEVTRENKTSNSMGFKYLGHILTAYPEVGSIVPYKPILFLRCRMFCSVSRLDEKGRVAAKRPKLFFSHIEPLEAENDGLL